MQLSLEDYQSLLLSLRPLGTRQHSDKRKHLRFDTEAKVTIVLMEPGKKPQPCSVTVTDVSRMGIRLARKAPMPIGQQFILCLTANNVSHTRPVVCIVRRTAPHPRVGFQMGCEFTDPGRLNVPTDQILQGLEEYQQRLFDADAVEMGFEPPKRKRSVVKRLASLLQGK
jgi:hypothetical protein